MRFRGKVLAFAVAVSMGIASLVAAHQGGGTLSTEQLRRQQASYDARLFAFLAPYVPNDLNSETLDLTRRLYDLENQGNWDDLFERRDAHYQILGLSMPTLSVTWDGGQQSETPLRKTVPVTVGQTRWALLRVTNGTTTPLTLAPLVTGLPLAHIEPGETQYLPTSIKADDAGAFPQVRFLTPLAGDDPRREIEFDVLATLPARLRVRFHQPSVPLGQIVQEEWVSVIDHARQTHRWKMPTDRVLEVDLPAGEAQLIYQYRFADRSTNQIVSDRQELFDLSLVAGEATAVDVRGGFLNAWPPSAQRFPLPPGPAPASP